MPARKKELDKQGPTWAQKHAEMWFLMEKHKDPATGETDATEGSPCAREYIAWLQSEQPPFPWRSMQVNDFDNYLTPKDKKKKKTPDQLSWDPHNYLTLSLPEDKTRVVIREEDATKAHWLRHRHIIQANIDKVSKAAQPEFARIDWIVSSFGDDDKETTGEMKARTEGWVAPKWPEFGEAG